MTRSHEARADNKPNAIVHFSRLVRGILRHCDAPRLRSRQPFQMTYKVAVASATETYRRVNRIGSEWIKEEPPAVATLVNPRTSFTALIATAKVQSP